MCKLKMENSQLMLYLKCFSLMIIAVKKVLTTMELPTTSRQQELEFTFIKAKFVKQV
jgi:hypothetical protein